MSIPISANFVDKSDRDKLFLIRNSSIFLAVTLNVHYIYYIDT